MAKSHKCNGAKAFPGIRKDVEGTWLKDQIRTQVDKIRQVQRVGAARPVG